MSIYNLFSSTPKNLPTCYFNDVSSGNLTVNGNAIVTGTLTAGSVTFTNLTVTNLTVMNNASIGATITANNGTINDVLTVLNSIGVTNTVVTPMVTSNSGIQLVIRSGSDAVNMQNGILLPTFGGVPSILDYYEVFGTTVTFNNAIPNTSVNLLFTRIGGIVFLKIYNFAVTSSNYSGTKPITGSAVIPTRFIPQNFRQTSIMTTGINIQTNGIVTIDTSGNINIYPTFSGGSPNGFLSNLGSCGIVGDQTVVYDILS